MLMSNGCKVAWLWDSRKINRVICRVNRQQKQREPNRQHGELVLYMIVVQIYYTVYDRRTRVLYAVAVAVAEYAVAVAVAVAVAE